MKEKILWKTSRTFLCVMSTLVTVFFVACTTKPDVPASLPLEVELTVSASRATIGSYYYTPKSTEEDSFCDDDEFRLYVYMTKVAGTDVTARKILDSLTDTRSAGSCGVAKDRPVLDAVDGKDGLSIANFTKDSILYIYAFYGDSMGITASTSAGTRVSPVVSVNAQVLYNDLDTLYPDDIASFFTSTCSCHSGLNVGGTGTATGLANANGKVPYFGEISNLLNQPSYKKEGVYATISRITAKKAAKSVLSIRVDDGTMPLRGSATEDQKTRLREWINEGPLDKNGDLITVP